MPVEVSLDKYQFKIKIFQTAGIFILKFEYLKHYYTIWSDGFWS